MFEAVFGVISEFPEEWRRVVHWSLRGFGRFGEFESFIENEHVCVRGDLYPSDIEGYWRVEHTVRSVGFVRIVRDGYRLYRVHKRYQLDVA